MEKISPFSYVNAINQGDAKFYLNNGGQAYNSFLINRAFSYFADTVMIAAFANQFNNLSDDVKYKYYINSVFPRQRFTKWYKPNNDEIIENIMNIFRVNKNKAYDILKLLSKEQLENIRALKDNEP